MDLSKNKNTIIAIVALIVVCGGSFLGAKALNKNTDAKTTAQIITTMPSAPMTESTTIPTTAATTTAAPTEPNTTAQPTNAQSLITTFPIDNQPTTTTAPSTTIPTTAATTVPTTASTTKVTTTKKKQTTTAEKEAEETIKNAAIFDQGFLSYMFDPEGKYYYTNSDPWQRVLGFNELYDTAAPFVIMYLDTMRCKFTYDDKDWLIQFWKGQYGYVFIGHEIGVYTKPTSRKAEHYDCASDEDSLFMSMTGYRDGKELYSREYGKYWWCTGFVPGKLDKFSDRSELEIRCRITMKDYKMLLAFCGSLKENGLVLGEDFTTNGLDVFVTW
ncbi:MAG: DUF4474 domain-containing protein [Oscillospiraceae bacterium]|nr:DUF4474 domain-containing protein [Oscillospiraceae bacterium]